MISLRTIWLNVVYRITFYSMSWFAGTLQYQRSGCDKQYLPERRSVSKIFAGTAPRRVPALLGPTPLQGSVATQVRRGSIFSNYALYYQFTREYAGEKNFENRSIFWQRQGQTRKPCCRREPRDAAVNSDRYRVRWHFAGAISVSRMQSVSGCTVYA